MHLTVKPVFNQSNRHIRQLQKVSCVSLFLCMYKSAALNMPANLENSAVAIGLENVRKAMLKNAQTTAQLQSSHMLVK